MQVMYSVLIYLETSLMKLDVPIIQRLQSIVVESVHESVFPLMHFLFQGRQGRKWIQSHS